VARPQLWNSRRPYEIRSALPRQQQIDEAIEACDSLARQVEHRKRLIAIFAEVFGLVTATKHAVAGPDPEIVPATRTLVSGSESPGRARR